MSASRRVWIPALALWIALLATGWNRLLRHEFTSGSRASENDGWPVDSALTRDPARPTLVLFAHRNCPCTRATLSELEAIRSRASVRPRVWVILVSPKEGIGERVGGGIEECARAIPDVQVILDFEGVEARRFGARTSGHVYLYGRSGELLFSGGITDARGHEGPSRGRRAVLERLQDEKAERVILPVYGCAIFFSDEDEQASPNMSPQSTQRTQR